MHCESDRPTGPDVPGRGDWNPERYGALRLTSALEIECRPWDFALRLGTGTSRWRFSFGGSGSGLGGSNGGSG